VEKSKDIQPGNLPGKRRGISRSDLIVLAFFLCLSFIFWYLNSLGKDLSADIKYPISYTNIPGEWKLGDDNPHKVNLLINGPGYSILQTKLSGKRSPLVIDFSRVNYKRAQNHISADYYVVTSNLVPNLNSQLKSVCKVTSIKPDTIFLSVE